MRSMREMYRRYFRPHRWMLLVGVLSFFFVCVSDGVVVGYLGRYLVDEVLEVDQAARTITHGCDERIIRRDEDMPVISRNRTLAGVSLRNAGIVEIGPSAPVLHRELPATAGLADRIDARTGRFTGQKITLLLSIAGAMIGVHLLSVYLGARAKVSFGTINKKVVFRLRTDLYNKLLRLQMSYHDHHHVGRLISRAVEDVRQIEWQVAWGLIMILALGGTIIVSCVVMLCINAKLALAVMASMPIFLGASFAFRRRIKSLIHVQRRDMARLYGLGADRLSHPRVVKGFGKEKREEVTFYRICTDIFRRRKRIDILKGLLAFISTFLSGAILAVALGYGVVLLRAGDLSLGYLLFFYGAASAMSMPMARLGVQLMEAQHLLVVFERVLAILGAPVTIADKSGSRELVGINSGIDFSGASLTYEGSDEPAISDINLHIPSGSQVCLMGRSGAGKSTLAALLLRLYDTTEGQILIDGVDLRDIRNKSLRRQIAYVPQEPMLFSGTVLSNITYGAPGANGEAVVKAAKAAEIHDFIESLPRGYQTLIGENGVRLSGGQKQRLSIARAMITDPHMLVLDDCTSALDAHTEARIRRTLRYALKGKTVLMVSHRMSAAAASDMIVVMNQGKIAEVGNHEELLARREDYWRLVHDQIDEKAVESAIETNNKVAASAR